MNEWSGWLGEFVEFGVDVGGFEEFSQVLFYVAGLLQFALCERVRLGFDFIADLFIDGVGVFTCLHSLHGFEHCAGGYSTGEFEHSVHQFCHLSWVLRFIGVMQAGGEFVHELFHFGLVQVGEWVMWVRLVRGFDQSF